MNSTMTGYEEVLNFLATQGSTDSVNNSSMEHAAIMIKTIFKHAKGTVRILADHLKPAVYNRKDLKDVVDAFFRKDPANSIELVLQFNEVDKGSLKANGFLAAMKAYQNRIAIFEASGEMKALRSHFMVTKTDKDNYAMRLEFDIEEHLATGSFNNESDAIKLLDYFNSNKESLAIPIAPSLVWS